MKSRTPVELDFDGATGIYLILNTMNNCAYVGQAYNLGDRLYTHRIKLTKGVHPNEAMQRDWNDFGAFNFEFSVLVTQAYEPRNIYFGILLNQLERLFMRVYQSRNTIYGYNSNKKNRQTPPVEPMFNLWLPAY